MVQKRAARKTTKTKTSRPKTKKHAACKGNKTRQLNIDKNGRASYRCMLPRRVIQPNLAGYDSSLAMSLGLGMMA